jgi:hypothetical protein
MIKRVSNLPLEKWSARKKKKRLAISKSTENTKQAERSAYGK